MQKLRDTKVNQNSSNEEAVACFECEEKPAVIYFHPWEIDPEQPRINVGIRSRFRHYINLDKTMEKVKHLLSSFKFAPIGQVLEISCVSVNKTRG